MNLFQIFQTPEPLSSHLQAMPPGQAELPQASGHPPLQPTPVNTIPPAHAASPSLTVTAPAGNPTQVSPLSFYSRQLSKCILFICLVL